MLHVTKGFNQLRMPTIAEEILQSNRKNHIAELYLRQGNPVERVSGGISPRKRPAKSDVVSVLAVLPGQSPRQTIQAIKWGENCTGKIVRVFEQNRCYNGVVTETYWRLQYNKYGVDPRRVF